MVRNLAPYAKAPNQPQPPITFPIIQQDLSVVDSPDTLIDTPIFADRLYPLNQYGADGGYEQVPDPNGLSNTHSNEGEYGVQDAHIIDEGYQEARTWKAINAYGDGLTVIDSAEAFSTLDVLQLNQGRTGNAQPYPTTFLASFYSPVSILLSPDPLGSNGLLSQDSFIARLGAKVLKKDFQDRIASEIRRRTLGRINLFNANSGTDILGLATGTIPIIEPNYQITVPQNFILSATDFALRLAGSVIPVSTIPGSYFDPNIQLGQSTTIQQLQGAYANVLGQQGPGILLGPTKSGSVLFLQNTGQGQKSRLFKNLDFNRYKPGYERTIFDRLSGGLVADATNNSNYYIGSTTTEPSRILSPSKSLPINQFGKEVQAPVFGPTEIAQLYEGPSREIKLGANGPTYSDGGGIEGGFTWVSPKYKDNAGKKVGPGGDIILEDPDYKESSYVPTESTNLTLKSGSILDQTQRLINSQPQGGKRLQHVGNAIDQVSKVFNDGYKELTKGSRVLSYVGDIGQEKGAEYCRVFAKDTPYLQYNDLQKTNGIVTEGRRFSFSVLDKTYNLNMYPNKREGGQDSTNLVMGGMNGEYAKKYMFSLENLAWRTSNKPGYTVSDLPVCERGPNGGRVMWFPPYDLKFNEGSTANWKSTDFIGRPEPIYTYNNTNRTGSISWKIVVDHPSVLNLIVNKVLASEVNKTRIDSILESFFAGCRKYDLYELAQKYYTVNPNDIFEIQKELQYQDVTTERIQYIKQQVETGVDGTPSTQRSVGGVSVFDFSGYNNLGFYFDNDIPQKGTISSYGTYYGGYISQKSIYQTNSPTTTVPYSSSAAQTAVFFGDVIENNFSKLQEMATNLLNMFTSNPASTAVLNLVGSASAPQTEAYNISLSERRIDSVVKWLSDFTIGDKKLGQYMSSGDGRFVIKKVPKGEGITVDVKPLGKGNQTYGPYNCTDDKDSQQTHAQKIYTVNAMACRRVGVTLTVNENPPDTTETIPGTPSTKVTNNVDVAQSTTQTTKVPTEVSKTVIRDNITKRVLRSLLSECDYFETIKEQTPMVYDNLREKLKFFNPAFHSMTPEGLNARLTFLQQCMRPGDTIPVTQKDGSLSYSNATNTSFGAPPVLILRVGDFFHTKIIPDNLQLTYENLDINPEGIGVQPMIANVTLSFKFVGGHGLANAVDKLQNALTFNYYANTEIYDDRADVTDKSYQVLDKQFLSYFNIQVPPPSISNTPNLDGQKNANTVGVITSATTTQSGTTGEINYQAYMGGIIDSSQTYFQNIFNKNKEVFSQYNNAVMQVWSKKRNYIKGKFSLNLVGSSVNVNLFGKPTTVEQNFDLIFNSFVGDIENGTEGFISFISSPEKNFSTKAIREIKNSYKTYVTNKKSSYQSAITKIIQDVVNQEQLLINNIARNNLITLGTSNVSGTDGLQQSNNFIKLYVTQPTTNVYDKTYTNTLQELNVDSSKIASAITAFYDVIETKTTFTDNKGGKYEGVLLYEIEKIPEGEVFVPFSNSSLFNSVSFQRSYFILNGDVVDNTKYQTFKQQIIGKFISNPSLLGNGDSDISTQFDAYWLTVVKPAFVDENDITKSFLDNMEKERLKNFLIFTPFDGAKVKKYEMTFTTDPNFEPGLKSNRELLIKSLGYSTNQYQTTDTWADVTPSGDYVCKVKLN
jgi:hypothetical protein